MKFSKPFSSDDLIFHESSGNTNFTELNHLAIAVEQSIVHMLKGKVENVENISAAFTHVLLEDWSIQETLLAASMSKNSWLHM